MCPSIVIFFFSAGTGPSNTNSFSLGVPHCFLFADPQPDLAALAGRKLAGHEILCSQFWNIVEQNPASDPIQANSKLIVNIGTGC